MIMKIKTIEVTIETEDGMKMSSLFCMPEYRTETKQAENPAFTFKQMPKSPVLWFKQLISRYHNI